MMKELSLHVLDIAQNSVKADATRLDITLEQAGNRLTIAIEDDGHGMSPAFAAAAIDPFTTTRTTRGVGMGLPLYKLAAEQTGGSMEIVSRVENAPGEPHGTRVTATFYTDHVDCAPLGDLAATIVTLLQGNPALALTYIHRSEEGEKRLSTEEMRELLGPDVPLNDPEVLEWARAYLAEPPDALGDKV